MFSDIKPGDTIFVKTQFRYGWGRLKAFTIPMIVKSVSKTEIKTEDGTRFKKNGNGVGIDGNLRIVKDGKDESKERDEFIKKIQLESKIFIQISEMPRLAQDSEFATEELETLYSDLQNIVKRLSEKGKCHA